MLEKIKCYISNTAKWSQTGTFKMVQVVEQMLSRNISVWLNIFLVDTSFTKWSIPIFHWIYIFLKLYSWCHSQPLQPPLFCFMIKLFISLQALSFLIFACYFIFTLQTFAFHLHLFSCYFHLPEVLLSHIEDEKLSNESFHAITYHSVVISLLL